MFFDLIPEEYTLANHKSAAKRARQTVKRTSVNSNRKSAVRTVEKSLLKALAAKDTKALPELLKNFMSQMTKAASRSVFKKQTASRHISRLSARVHQIVGTK